MFILQENPIYPDQLRHSYSNDLTGAFISFEGIIRADHQTQTQVSSLFYTANKEDCLNEGQKIITESLSLFDIQHALCVQRIGQVNAGELATWIGVWSAHRDMAFKGSRYIIEEIKKRLLIWKKEHYADGSSKWIHGTQKALTI